MEKREFFKTMGLLTGGAMIGAFKPASAASLLNKTAMANKKVGLQIYSLGKELTNDVPAGLNRIAEIGYSTIELAGYRDRKMGKYTVGEYRKLADDAGLKITGSHVNPPVRKYTNQNLNEISDFWKVVVEDHVKLGVKSLVQPGMPIIESHDDAAIVAEVFNTAGEIAKKAGICWGYHNHHMEFQRVATEKQKKEQKNPWIPAGDVIYDLLLDNTEPSLVFFEMDVYWTVMGQNDPVEYFDKYAGRFPILHIKDRSILGKSGMMNFENIFKKAYENGLDEFYVELENIRENVTQFEGVKQCFNYLNSADFVR
ncbi:Sugar phosphate isomerase/epimerase [Mariniphaga anaerophila]|uniref:Sugar phosphate isomerase/epimerase n=1 Tax=Mariniphaga anaerophila TaxID=1484053 RepID=A0A1M5GA41_9BACT|nr:sugar phosphate isomerase/epimerase [Mariniphaga anaerophila]SHG00637.1 Sugar phosphate isomerase/epimerase [Mariniphaga anaerophila]